MKKSSFIYFYSNLEKLTTNLVMVSFKNQIYADAFISAKVSLAA